MLLLRKALLAHVGGVALERAPDLRGQVHVPLHEARGPALVEPQQVVVDEHLTIGRRPCADPDRRHGQSFGDTFRDRGRDCFEHDREAAGALEG